MMALSDWVSVKIPLVKSQLIVTQPPINVFTVASAVNAMIPLFGGPPEAISTKMSCCAPV
jgi:hypothetical protein